MTVSQLFFVHASDLHMGKTPEQNGYSFIGGYASHDVLLCSGFMTAFLETQDDCQDDDLQLVVSGDLTAGGLPAEFTVAHTYLQAEWLRKRLPPSSNLGLGLKPARHKTVPGNHDHWDGTRFPARSFSPRAIRPHFRKTPWRATWLNPSSTIELELFGIDSNSGLTARNAMGHGNISPQELNELRRLLAQSPPVDPGVVRVRAIMLHHSLAYRQGRLLPQVMSPLVLSAASVDQLIDIATANGVSAFLTGHTHDAYHETFSRMVGGVSREVHELRCPTTLQGPARPGGAGFLLHQIALDPGGRPTWAAWMHGWSGTEFLRLPVSNPTPMARFSVL